MLQNLISVYRLLTSAQKIRFARIQFLIFFSSCLEVLSIMILGPFMAIISTNKATEAGAMFSDIFSIFDFQSEQELFIFITTLTLIIIMMSSILSMITLWRTTIFAASIGAELSSRLYKFYIYKDWLFHSSTSSSHLTNNIQVETSRIGFSIINPIMQINAKLVTSCFILFGIFLYSPIIAFISSFIFILAYSLIFWLLQQRFSRNSFILSTQQERRFRLLNEGYGGIRNAILMRKRKLFSNRFKDASKNTYFAWGSNQVLSLFPRYFMELVAIGTLLIIVLISLIYTDNSSSQILPTLSVFAFAALKLLPAFQQIYASFASIKGNISAFEGLKNDLMESLKFNDSSEENEDSPVLKFKNKIDLSAISFAYPSKDSNSSKNRVLSSLNMRINVNETIGIVGASGSGKSTLVDILLGLILPDSGTISIDGSKLSEDNMDAWQRNIGYVPQNIFLSDASIVENIAYGIPLDSINFEKVNNAIKMSNLEEVINNLKNGLKTNVGERGVQLSGGQIQRIGIARALYSDPDVLIFDEATSSLDGIAENSIMHEISSLFGQKTIIIIAHRLGTVKNADKIFLIENGATSESGTFKELKEKSSLFKRMTDSL
jgi:ATP-binding cassette, subfamily B, bacterial PglK